MVNGGIAIVFDSTPQFKAMLDDTLPKNLEGEVVEGFGVWDKESVWVSNLIIWEFENLKIQVEFPD